MDTGIGFSGRGRFKREDKSKKEDFPVQNEKALFLQCHMGVITVKLIG
jgi:hypothetical protein